jgi:hypothetical protein
MTIAFRLFLSIIWIPFALLLVHCSVQAQSNNARKANDEQQALELMEKFNRELQEQPRTRPALVPVPDMSSGAIYSKRELTTFKLTIVLLEQAEVKKKCAALGAWGGKVPVVPYDVGCTLTNLDKNEATIYASRPLTLNDQRTLVLGHELWHAIAGRYHEE